MSDVVAEGLSGCEGGAPTKDGVIRRGGIGFLSIVQKETYELIPDDTHLRDGPTDLRMLISAPSSMHLSSSAAGALALASIFL